MSFERRTLSALVARVSGDMESRIPGAGARPPRSNIDALSRTVAASVHGLYGYIEYQGKNLLPTTATDWLERHAGLWGVGRKAASKAGGTITITGTTGAVIPAGAGVKRSDGVEYATSAEVTLVAGTAAATVTALIVGLNGNADADLKVSFISPIAGVQSSADIAAGGLTGGADIEAVESHRARLVDRVQNPPHGGAQGDWTRWALEVPGVTRAWEFPQEQGIGTMTVRFMTDNSTADGIPTAGDVTVVQDYIDQVRPVAMRDFLAAAPVAVPLNFNISGLNPATQTVKDAIEAQLRDLIRRECIPGGTLRATHISEAISVAAGEYDHVLVAPVGNVTVPVGSITTFGNMTWS